MTRRPLLLATALATMALPAVAQAHSASVVCNPSGGYIGIADYQQFHPAFTITPPTATVRWDDGFRLVVPLPTGCVVVPETPTAPPVVETPAVPIRTEIGTDVAPAPPLPVVVTPGVVEPQPRKRVTSRRVTCRYLLAHRAGKWSYIRRGYYPFCRVPRARKVPNISVAG